MYSRLLTLLIVLVAGPCRASISDLSLWTLVEDPPHANLSATVSASEATLSATGGPIPNATDIGYQSVDGATGATSTSGFLFDIASDFSLAIDFSITFTDAVGSVGLGFGLGFGIGEDSDGTDSAGAAVLFSGGAPWLFFGAAARVNDQNQAPLPIALGASATGSLFASYEASSGDVTLGASTTPDAASPTATATYGGIQKFLR